MDAARAAEQAKPAPAPQGEAPPAAAEAKPDLPGVGAPKYAAGEMVTTKWGPAAVIGMASEPHPENGWQYKVRRDADGGEHSGAEFFQYERALSAPAAEHSEPAKGNGNGSAFLFCKRDQHQVNAIVCDQKCADRDDCPELAAHQAKNAPAKPAGGLFG
jgi:hypothetical protein